MAHIVIWERIHGRLRKGWVIHHRDERTDDNDIDNLVALPRRLHRELHVQLNHIARQHAGTGYSVRRYVMTDDFIKRSTALESLRRYWRQV